MAKSSGRQMSINIIASIVSFAVTVGINFFLTPYLVKELGTEAYGFIGLSNNFVQYATVITTALNSIAGRFISLEYHNGNKEKASKIFSSVLVADLFLAAVLLVASAFLTFYLDLFIDIPAKLITSVKITFGFAFATFVVSTVTAIFTTAAFVKNRIDINSIRDIISNLIKVALIVVLFTTLPAKLYYISMASFASGLFLLTANITVKKKILPDVKISFKNFDIKLVKVLLMSGIWLSLSQLCNVLMTGLDLLICNLTLGTLLIKILSITKTVPNSIGNLNVILGNVFTPHFTILYAQNKIDDLVDEAKFTSRIMSFILMVPYAGFMAFGHQFYTLWQPTKTPEEITMIQIMSILTCVTYVFSCQTQSLMMLNTVCNKLKLPVFINLSIGLVSVGIVLIFVNTTDIGVYAIAGVSSILMALRSIFFVPMYAAHLLKRKLTTFYPSIIRGWINFALLFVIFAFINSLFTLDSWVKLVAVCAAAAVIGYIISAVVLFKKSELKKILNKVTGKFKKA